MYIVKKTATDVDLYSNTPDHGIDWTNATPYRQVTLLSATDYDTVAAWKNAGAYTAGIAPIAIPDEDNREPQDEGYVPTYSAGTSSVWELASNQVCTLADGTVELRDSLGDLIDLLPGTVIQKEA